MELAAELNLPAIYTDGLVVREGGLMSYSADYAALMCRTAHYVDLILKGARPGELPVEEPRAFNFAVNLKMAKSLGLLIPQSLLLRASTVVQ